MHKKAWTPVRKQQHLSPSRKKKIQNLECSPDNIFSKSSHASKNQDLECIMNSADLYQNCTATPFSLVPGVRLSSDHLFRRERPAWSQARAHT